MENLSNKLNEYPRDCNYYQDQGENYGYVVIPAGKVDIGEGHFVNFYHTIFEDAIRINRMGNINLLMNKS